MEVTTITDDKAFITLQRYRDLEVEDLAKKLG